MLELFHIPTLMLCFFTWSAIIAIFVTTMWAGERGRLDLACWALAFWIGSLGTLLLAFRGVAPAWLAIGLGNLVALVSPGLFLVGLRVFDGRRPCLWLVAVGPLAWAACYFGLPTFSTDINARVALVSIAVFLMSAEIGRIAWRGRDKEESKARTAVAFFFGTHALVYLARLPLVHFLPLTEQDGLGRAGWYAFFTFELYVHALFAGMSIFVLVRERIEYRYRSASEIDPLTGAFNRRAFLQRAGVALKRFESSSLALLDIDHFKRINDNYGHPMGDAALQAFCDRVTASLPPTMIFGRIGGEEFALWMPGYAMTEAHALCEDIRQSVASLTIAPAAGAIRLSVSIGLCGDVERDQTMEYAMGVADHALYMSKRRGRDHVTAIGAQEGVDRAVEHLGGSGLPVSPLADVPAIRLV